jgi:hypothetical protein
MAIRNSLLGGVDWVKEHPTHQDLNQTNNAIIETALKGQAQIPYSTLKSTGDWVNEGYLGADRFTTANGVNGTVNTGETTAFFDTNKYTLTSLYFTETYSQGSWSATSTNFTLQGNNIVGETGKEYFFSSITFNTQAGPGTVTVNIKKGTTVIATKTFSAGAGGVTTNFTKEDYTELIENGNTNWNINIVSQFNLQVISTAQNKTTGTIRFNSGVFQGGMTLTKFDPTFEKNVICDTNISTLKGDEKLISIYTDTLIPTGTNIKVQVSDETKVISENHILEPNESVLIPLTVTPNVGEKLKLTFTLETEDTEVTPSISGYGVIKK